MRMIATALSPVVRTTLAHEVVERLRRAILAGELTAGAALTEAAMAARLSVSRVPVREALVELEREGLIEFDARGRASVREFTEEDFAEIVSIRSALAVLSAKLAARRHTDEDLGRLEAIVDKSQRTRDPTEFSRLDIAFHDEIVRIARHKRLHQSWSNLRAQMELWIAHAHRQRQQRTRDVREATVLAHRAMIATLRSRDVEASARMMERHCESLSASRKDNGR